MKIEEIDAITGVSTLRDMTAEELAQYEIDAANYAAEELRKAQMAEAKAALLAKLGITQEEARLLLS